MNRDKPRAEALSSLCVKDQRSPSYADLFGGYELNEIPEPRKDCYCDKCFRGNDDLALIILSLLDDGASE